ncbi:MAG: Crp/Fnr family transcriptional regulator [Thermoleophilaceae bacterium]|nr:Crp/Fnr family transcriptional regulator [Thermoleophilaceae bacterium]
MPQPRQLNLERLPWRPVRLLDADVGLGEGLDARQLEEARSRLLAPAANLTRGAWRLELEPPPPGAALGILVLDGLIARIQEVGELSAVEFLGPGDVVRPWTYGSEEISALPVAASWEVIRNSRIALLDHGFALRAGRCPQVLAAVLERVVARSRSLAFALAVRQLVRVDDRILVTLWHLADRWGRTRPGGCTLPLPELSHEMLARMVAARRPSVTTALSRLRERALVERAPDGGWLLNGEPPADLVRPRARRARLEFQAAG